MAERDPAIPLGKLAQGLGLQTVILCAAGAALWHFSGRELARFVDLSWISAAHGFLFGGALIAAAALVFRLFPRVLEHTSRLQSKMAALFTARSNTGTFAWIALCAGIGEEAFFRGGLQTLLSDHIGVAPAIVVGAAGFALIHLAKPLIGAVIFVIGIVFGAVFWWTGSLLAVMIGHAVYDLWALRMLHRELGRLGYFAQGDTVAADESG